MGCEIKVMSFNLRLPAEVDGENNFWNRTDGILEVIGREKPAIIGFQEAVEQSMDFLTEELNEYYVLGHGRDKNLRGEIIPIAFRKDLFRLKSFHTEWLSYTPQCPASRLWKSDQSACPRMLLSAELIHKETGRVFSFFNIHTDHRGEMARYMESCILLTRIAETPNPVIATGDFNAQPDSAPIRLLLDNNKRFGLVDATGEITGTFHGFTGETKDRKIDYIFTNLPTDPTRSYAITDTMENGRPYSDHHAVCAWVDLEEPNESV